MKTAPVALRRFGPQSTVRSGFIRSNYLISMTTGLSGLYSDGSWNRHNWNGRNIRLTLITPPPGEHWTIAIQLAPRDHQILIENAISIADRHVWRLRVGTRNRKRSAQLPHVVLYCPSQRENSHANRTRPSTFHETPHFVGFGEMSVWVRFPSPALLFVVWRAAAGMENGRSHRR